MERAKYLNAAKACQPSSMERVYEKLSLALGRFFPPVCMLCLDPGQPPALDLCRACQADLPRDLPACTGCALPRSAVCANLSCAEM